MNHIFESDDLINIPSSMKTHISSSFIFIFSILFTSLFFFRWSIWSCNQLIQDMLNRNPISISQLHLQDTNLWNSILMIRFVLFVNSGQKHQCRSTMAGKLASAVEHFSGMHNSGDGSGLDVKVRNMKMDFNTAGTWHRVRQWTLMMKIYDFFLFG